jgi:hypothetical protein
MLAALPVSESTLRVALLYGVLGLVGFLAQAIVGFERRIVPIASAYWALQRTGGAPTPAPRPPVAPAWIFFAWLCGVPLVAAGLFVTSATTLASGAWLLFAGTFSSVNWLRHQPGLKGGSCTKTCPNEAKGRILRMAAFLFAILDC